MVTSVDGLLFADTDDAAMVAFAYAEGARQYRLQLIAQLELGELNLAELFDLDLTDSRVRPIKVVVLLQAVPGVGKVAARKALDQLSLDENVRVGQLGRAARVALTGLLARPS
jgi:hypothetical protein